MKKIIFILAIISLASCSYQKRLNNWCAKCPQVVQHDTTIIKHDSIVTHDSIVPVQLPPLPADTIMIDVPCPASGIINIAKKTYHYDYVDVDVWVTHNQLNVKPYIKNNKINVLIKNARTEVYRNLYEKYKDYKAVTVRERFIPWWIYALWILSILFSMFILLFMMGANRND